jgi:hypothetical protein
MCGPFDHAQGGAYAPEKEDDVTAGEEKELKRLSLRLRCAGDGISAAVYQWPGAPPIEAVTRFAETISAQLAEFERAVEEARQPIQHEDTKFTRRGGDTEIHEGKE